MVKRIEHLGIAVDNIEDALCTFEVLLSAECYKQEVVESEGVRTAFIQVGESKIELLEATNEDSPIAKYLSKNRGGFHHVAFEVDDLDKELGYDWVSLIESIKEFGTRNSLLTTVMPTARFTTWLTH